MPVKLKVLVIDPDPVARQVVVGALIATGAEPCALGSGQEAANLVGREKFDGIFLDWRTPDIAAVELMRHIRRSKWNYAAPIIAMAAENELQAMAESFKYGVAFFLGKPLTAHKVQSLLAVSRGLILEERRQFQRAKVAVPVGCRHQQNATKASSVDLSARGVLVSADKLYPAETNLELNIELPAEREVTVRPSGRVVRVTPEEKMGISFLRLSPKERKEIADFVEQTLKKQQLGSRK